MTNVEVFKTMETKLPSMDTTREKQGRLLAVGQNGRWDGD